MQLSDNHISDDLPIRKAVAGQIAWIWRHAFGYQWRGCYDLVLLP